VQELCSKGLFVAAGLHPGSPALKPSAGLALSLLKLANAAISARPLCEIDVDFGATCVTVVLCFSSWVLQAASSSISAEQGSSSSAVVSMLSRSKVRTAPWDTDLLSAISDSIASTATSTTSNTDAVPLLPWLVILGRCCMGYALVLQLNQAGTVASTFAPARDRSIQFTLGLLRQTLQELVAVLPAWLQSSSVSTQLATAGYNTQRVIELLESAAQAGQDVPAAGAAPVVSPDQLQKLGLALSILPVKTACNNPRCSSLADLSEQQLVVGKARACAGCRVARYCSRACQVAAWKQHKPACKAVASARAAKAAEKDAWAAGVACM
jgi:hypothetical protein